MSELLGRDDAVARIEGLLRDIHERGDTLLIRADPGMGKTSVLAVAESMARTLGYHILRTTGVESEAQLPFACLHQLLRPVLGRVERLPAPQRTAIQTAFGQMGGSAPDLFLVGLAVLNLLADLAGERPVLVLADDVRWLDSPSAEVLAFVARRVASDPVVVLVALRHGHESQLLHAGLPELRLGPLDGELAARLLDDHAPGLDSSTRDLLLSQAAGNPLALVELPRAIRVGRRSDVLLSAETLPLTDRLEQAFAARASELPLDTRTAILVAALDDRPDLNEIMAAASRVTGRPLALDVLQPAVSATLMTMEGTDVRFRHPLVRSAVDRSASVAMRLAAHGALAEVIEADPDRRAWHRAASILGKDDVAASDLEAAARRSGSRGAAAVALAGMERAAALTSEPQRRAKRLLAAAELGFELGQPGVVGRLVVEAEALGLGERDRGRATWLREAFDDGVTWDHAAVHRLIAAAGEAVAGGDIDLAFRLFNAAAWRCWWARPGDDARDEVVAAIGVLPVDPSEPRVMEIVAMISPVDGFSRVATDARETVDHPLDAETARMIGFASHAVGDFESSHRLLSRAIDGFRAEGRLGLLTRTLTVRAWDLIHMGRLQDAERDAAEGWRLAAETGQPVWNAGASIARGLLAGLRGDTAIAGSVTDDAESVLLPMRLSNLLSVNQLARGLAALTAGETSQAFDNLRRMFDPQDVSFDQMELYGAVGYLAESAVHAGRPDEATELMPSLEALGARTAAPVLHAGLRFARSILADDRDAEALYLAAIGADPGWPFASARLRLAYGAWLRRQRRVSESRQHLRAARDMFESVGADPWAERARQELRATGERSPERATTTRESLSPQERQIAEMAGAGMSNRAIGERLFLSHRTVGSHLYRIFPKLGITSRAELRQVMSEDGQSI